MTPLHRPINPPPRRKTRDMTVLTRQTYRPVQRQTWAERHPFLNDAGILAVCIVVGTGVAYAFVRAVMERR